MHALSASSRTPLAIGVLALSCVLALTGCGDTTSNGNGDGDDTGSGTATATDGTGGTADVTETDDGDTSTSSGGDTSGDTAGPGAGYALDPPMGTVAVTPGQRVDFDFDLVQTDASGNTAEITADSWRVDAFQLATVDGGGTVTTSGASGGILTISALVGGGPVAAGQLTIEFAATDFGAFDPSVAALFPPNGTVGSDPTQAPNVVYPYQETVFPSGMYPPIVQWTDPYGAAPDAVYRMLIQRGPISLESYTRGTGVPTCPNDPAQGRCLPITPQQWRYLVDGNAAEDFEISIWGRPDEDPNNPSYPAAALNARLVEANLTGRVYYYYVVSDRGQIQSIDIALQDTPPTNERVIPEQSENRCHGCHALSRDGRRMATEVSAGDWPGWESAIFDLDDLSDASAWFARPDDTKNWKGTSYAWNPDGTRLLSAYVEPGIGNDHRMMLSDPDGQTQTQVLDGATHPDWSPDGGLVAYTGDLRVGGENEDPRIDFDRGNLYTMTASTAVDGSVAWGTPTRLVDAGDQATSWPSFTPDSRRIGYSMGELTRLTEHSSGTPLRNGLYLVDATGGDPVFLDRTSLEVGPNGETYDLQPVFSPFLTTSADGSEQFYWVLFQSIRPYGVVNEDIGRHQLWVAAVTKEELAQGDPGHPAFWLPGQDVDTNNIMGFWAANPCGKDYGDGSADSCSAESPCCDGYVCTGQGMCERELDDCVVRGNACTSDDECCTGLSCLENGAGDSVCAPVFN